MLSFVLEVSTLLNFVITSLMKMGIQIFQIVTWPCIDIYAAIASRDVMNLFCHVTSQDNLIENSYKFLSGRFLHYHHLDMFCDLSIGSSGDIKFLICQVTSRDHIYKGLYKFLGGNLSTKSRHLAMFGSHCFIAIGDIKYLIDHMTSKN